MNEEGGHQEQSEATHHTSCLQASCRGAQITPLLLMPRLVGFSVFKLKAFLIVMAVVSM